ncbi:MAG: glycerol-3-phosphate acyltransferase, partial [Polyangiaceae bacterium]
IWGLAVWATGFASVGSLIASFSTVLTLWLFVGGQAAVYGICVTALIAWRHRENIRRLREGRENRLIGASGSASNPGPLP